MLQFVIVYPLSCSWLFARTNSSVTGYNLTMGNAQMPINLTMCAGPVQIARRRSRWQLIFTRYEMPQCINFMISCFWNRSFMSTLQVWDMHQCSLTRACHGSNAVSNNELGITVAIYEKRWHDLDALLSLSWCSIASSQFKSGSVDGLCVFLLPFAVKCC